MLNRAGWLVVLAMTGCGGATERPGPESRRLAVGEFAIVSSTYKDSVFVVTNPENTLVERIGFSIDVGTRVRCEADNEESTQGPDRDYKVKDDEVVKFEGEGGHIPKVETREVRVLLVDGPRKGRIVPLARYHLRPAE